MKSFTGKEMRMFGCMTVFAIGLLGAVWGWFAFTAMPVVNFPKITLPQPNAFDTFQQAAAVRVSAPGGLSKQLFPSYDVNEPVPPFPTARAQVWLKQNKTTLQLLRQGLKQQYHEPPVRSMWGSPPYYGGFRELARILSTESTTRGHLGDWKGAADSALDAVRFGYQLPHGAPLLGALVGYAVQGIGRSALEMKLPHFDAVTCRQAARRLEALQAKRVPFAETMTEEKWYVQASMLQMMKVPGGWAFQASGGGSNKKAIFRLSSRRRMMTELITYIDALITSAKQPYATAVTPPAPDNFLVDSIAYGYGRARWNDARCETRNALLMLALALRAYQLEHGAYPNTLSQLTPDYLKTVPADPFGSGEALRYKKQGSTYLLWSIGPDKKDDGGKPIRDTKPRKESMRRFMQPDSKGDFVFGVNR